jgi:hypothetical protein
MSASDTAAGIIGTLIGVWGLYLLPRVWRGYLERRETSFRGRLRTHGELGLIWWPFGETTRRGAVRGYVAIDLAWFAGVLGFWALQISIHSTDPASHSWRVIASVFLGCFAVGFALALTVIFFNWPKFIVPPSQRDECGALAEWRRRGASRTNRE